jgi:dTDP-4-amino-4,6-dideoxygalactose transaminase
MNSAAGFFPVAEKCASEFVSLPMYPELTETQIQYVSDAIKIFFPETLTS